ncbi:Uncharacterised protein [Mycobacteroides abscessus subsp. abscessus]|nr:polynucleotide kinase [Mycobacterium phage prophiT37-1]SID31471.1 Uncharacterised protein [Mycobacteroides abscessus subsp. abscessus]SID69020.1 Uncharacterised protein [Mycobacteroides abscessus subsp. abscessus]SKG38377.1 Uncharacterised protein [Mycobacteroides abscessus subsp. abscessus]SKQ80707.1 Uncharacterised protein [Mycobacteroides abscessus subsp. abscessus]
MLYVVTGPPAAGKSTWVQANAQPGDITIDYDAIASVLTPPHGDPHSHPEHVKAVTKAARQAAIDAAVLLIATTDVYVIHSTPSEALLTKYRALGAEVVTINPGKDVVLARAQQQRPHNIQQAARHWYETHDEAPTTPVDPANVQGLDADGRPRSRAYRKLVADFRTACAHHTNDDGTTGAPCWICHHPIDYTITDPYHPDVFNADHAAPVKERPELAMDINNLRPSHRDCNLKRGTDDAHIDIGLPSEQW